jgi:tRNA A37 methylthiotransferase MiaB
LLDKVSRINPEIRIRFTSPHPKVLYTTRHIVVHLKFILILFRQDFPDEVLQLIKERPNICKSLHLPAQAGSNRVLSLMRRNYTREAYLELVDKVISVCGSQVALSSDFICGFCGETESEFLETLDLVERVPYTTCYIFPYSLREV